MEHNQTKLMKKKCEPRTSLIKQTRVATDNKLLRYVGPAAV